MSVKTSNVITIAIIVAVISVLAVLVLHLIAPGLSLAVRGGIVGAVAGVSAAIASQRFQARKVNRTL